jgi:hypothetical protein
MSIHRHISQPSPKQKNENEGENFMTRIQLVAMAIALGVFSYFAQTSQAHPPVRWSIGLNFGAPAYYHPRPWYGYSYAPYYYPAPAVIYAPPPVVVRPAPYYVEATPPVTTSPAPTVVAVPAVTTSTSSIVPIRNESTQADTFLARLSDANEQTRRDAAMELGRMKAQSAIDPLTTLLAKDSSAAVRDAAARGLGLIAAPRSLNALIYAAQADADRDVRHSAQFAVEIIRSNLRGN